MSTIPVLPLTLVVDREGSVNSNVIYYATHPETVNGFASSWEVANEIMARLGKMREVRIIGPKEPRTPEMVPATFTYDTEPPAKPKGKQK
jgi:hypothetical protein